ncbi:hypothetical protein THAR02_01703 [Trichoderma harzianum]|uniref:Peptidase A2 domain-containing protein n=1 Tax=Trichoderma harzianum TaxID=5544 RepID=A0A0F9XNU5_TRIHA|nr:hypothetical protein THAR02_01703 [Trichoderma harzianum]
MDRMLNLKRPKDKNAKSKSRLSMFGREKDRADQQAYDNGGTPEPSPLINSAFPNPDPVDSSNAASQPPASDTATLSPDDEYQNTPIVELWNSTYEKLRKENKELIDGYEAKLQESPATALDPVPDTKENRQRWMSQILRQKMEQIQKDAWKFMFLGSEIRPAETVESVLRVIKMVNDSITATIVPNSCVSLAWTGKASRLISDFSMKNDWRGLVEDIRRQEAQMVAIDKIWRDQRYDDECAASERRYQGTILNLKTIGADISTLREAVEGTNRDRNQKEFLDWLCDIDPSDLYNAARKRHKAGTSEWLIKVNDLDEYKKKGMRPSTEELQNSFISTLHGFTNREELMEILHYILDSNLNNLHLFCTSRKEPDIDVSLRRQLSEPGRGALDISSHMKEIERDIGEYIDSTLTNAKYSSWPNHVKAEIRKVLIEKSDGMFQYIRCQFEALQKLSSLRDIHQALEDLPKGLDETYDRMLQGIDDRYRKPVANSLKWLAFSVQPLTVDELAEIFIMHPYDAVVIDNTERLFATRDVLIYFSGLIVENQETVRLAHFSIKEYLVSSRIRQHFTSTFSFSDIDAHLFIAYSCFSYIRYMSTLANEGDDQSHALKVYAARNCLIHLEMVPSEYWHAGVIDILRFIGSKYLTQQDLDTALWYAVYGRRKEVAVLLLERGADPNTSRIATSDIGYKFVKHGDVLQIAVSWGDAAMVKLLLDRGADINAQRWGSALQTAAERGRLDILKLLVERGAKINGPSNEKGTVLSAAIRHDDLECLQFLLDSGADINMLGTAEGARTALCEAATCKRWRQFDLLLDRGADVNIGGEGGYPLEQLIDLRYWPPSNFSSMPRFGSPGDALPRIERLLSLGANPNAQARDHHTALHAAVSGWKNKNSSFYEQVAQLLIDNGADVNIRACTGIGNKWATEREMREPQPLLYHCAFDGSTSMAKLLLENGAAVDVTLQTGQFGNALQMASSEGHIEMMQLLLDHGAQVNIQGGYYGTALNAACARSFSDDAIPIIRLLLERGADVNIGGGEFGFPLQAVCARSIPEAGILAQILLDHGADVNARGGEYGTALQAACVHSPTTVQLLLDHGADINAAGGEYGNALQAACIHYPTIVRLLLDRGANVNAEGGQYGTALQAALYRYSCDPDLVQLLVDRGADVNANGGLYGSCLQIACANGLSYRWQDGFETWWIERILFLLDHGADANLNVGELGSPLHVACAVQYDCESLSTYVHDEYEQLEEIIGKRGIIINLMTKGVETLLNKCQNIDINAHGGIFGTALQAAAYSGQLKTVQLLLRRKDFIMCNEPCGKYGSALNAAVIRAHWDIVDVLLEAGAKPDCHMLQEPDEEFLARIREEHGWAAEERYKKFWEVEKKELTTDAWVLLRDSAP